MSSVGEERRVYSWLASARGGNARTEAGVPEIATGSVTTPHFKINYEDRSKLGDLENSFKLFSQRMKAGAKNGRPLLYSDQLIQMLFLVKIRFGLPYRALEGFAKELFCNRAFLIPTYSLICKRVSRLNLSLSLANSKGGIVVILDGSEMKIYGEGGWIKAQSVPH